jgi:hypothetical protein
MVGSTDRRPVDAAVAVTATAAAVIVSLASLDAGVETMEIATTEAP